MPGSRGCGDTSEPCCGHRGLLHPQQAAWQEEERGRRPSRAAAPATPPEALGGAGTPGPRVSPRHPAASCPGAASPGRLQAAAARPHPRPPACGTWLLKGWWRGGAGSPLPGSMQGTGAGGQALDGRQGSGRGPFSQRRREQSRGAVPCALGLPGSGSCCELHFSLSASERDIQLHGTKCCVSKPGRSGTPARCRRQAAPAVPPRVSARASGVQQGPQPWQGTLLRVPGALGTPYLL